MKWFKTVVTMLLLALWLPATSHALLEQVGWVHTAHADTHHASDADADHDNDHDAADGLCRVASTNVQVPPTIADDRNVVVPGDAQRVGPAQREALPRQMQRSHRLAQRRNPSPSIIRMC